MQSPLEIRKAAHVSQLQVAAATNTSIPTVRVFEVNPGAVSPEKHAVLAPFYRRLAERGAEALHR